MKFGNFVCEEVDFILCTYTPVIWIGLFISTLNVFKIIGICANQLAANT